MTGDDYDWQHDEEMWEEEQEKEEPPKEKQCKRCLHWIAWEAPVCAWCGKVYDERDWKK